MPLSGPRPTRSTREKSAGTVNEEDFKDFTELDPEWMKRQHFGKYCWDLLCKEVIEREKNKKKAKSKLKRDEKKEKRKVMVAPQMPIIAATAITTASSNGGDGELLTTTTPSSPSKRSHEEAE